MARPSTILPSAAARRALLLGLAALLLAIALSSDVGFALLSRAVAAFQPVLSAHPRASAALFVLLSALSAMLAFFSSAVLVPAAAAHWGAALTAAFLWIGWLLGGLASYWLARAVGRPVVRLLGGPQVTAWADRLSSSMSLVVLLLLQLALPSEIPGYLCGLLRVSPRLYLPALALGEIPFALGTVVLGESVILRRPAVLVGLGAGAAALSLIAARLLSRRLGRGERDSSTR
jgi:uncharacterized membrane protein YdjX (TVP38/TMEM64 family)